MNFNSLHQITTLGFNDLPLFIELCIAYGIFRLVLTYLVISKIAKLIKFKSDFVRFKFIHRGFDLVHYTSSAIIGLFAISTRPYSHCYYYSFDCGIEFIQQAEPTDRVVMSNLEKIYYMVFTAYYVVDIFFIWTNNHDRRLLALHHATTLSLIFISVYIRTHVIGVCVMLLHDVVDVPLYLGKVCTYLNCTNIQDVSLIIFAAGCTWFRMLCYPAIIYHGIKNGINKVPEHLLFYCIEGCILFSLMFCHIVWYIRIVKAAINLFSKGKDAICDNRSDDATNYIE